MNPYLLSLRTDKKNSYKITLKTYLYYYKAFYDMTTELIIKGYHNLKLMIIFNQLT